MRQVIRLTLTASLNGGLSVDGSTPSRPTKDAYSNIILIMAFTYYLRLVKYTKDTNSNYAKNYWQEHIVS